MITDREKELWGLLDDIDTLSDMLKEPMEKEGSFQARALEIAKKRHGILHSDGYELYESEDDVKPPPSPMPPMDFNASHGGGEEEG